MDLQTAKGICIAVFFFIPILVGAPLLCLVSKYRGKLTSARAAHALSYVNCFAGGVFLGTCLMSVLSEGREQFEEFREAAAYTVEYPFFELGIGVGFFLVALVEKLAHKIHHHHTSNHHHHHHHHKSIVKNHPKSVNTSNGKVWETKRKQKRNPTENETAFSVHAGLDQAKLDDNLKATKLLCLGCDPPKKEEEEEDKHSDSVRRNGHVFTEKLSTSTGSFATSENYVTSNGSSSKKERDTNLVSNGEVMLTKFRPIPTSDSPAFEGNHSNDRTNSSDLAAQPVVKENDACNSESRSLEETKHNKYGDNPSAFSPDINDSEIKENHVNNASLTLKGQRFLVGHQGNIPLQGQCYFDSTLSPRCQCDDFERCCHADCHQGQCQCEISLSCCQGDDFDRCCLDESVQGQGHCEIPHSCCQRDELQLCCRDDESIQGQGLQFDYLQGCHGNERSRLGHAEVNGLPRLRASMQAEEKPCSGLCCEDGPGDSDHDMEEDNKSTTNNESRDFSHETSGVRVFLLFLAMSFHTVFDGLAVGLQTDPKVLWSILAAIAVHKTLVSICLALELAEVVAAAMTDTAPTPTPPPTTTTTSSPTATTAIKNKSSSTSTTTTKTATITTTIVSPATPTTKTTISATPTTTAGLTLPLTLRFFLPLLLFAVMAPVGVAIGMAVTSSEMHEPVRLLTSGILQAVATGAFLYVTCFEILGRDMASGHDGAVMKVVTAVAGYGIMCVLKVWDSGIL